MKPILLIATGLALLSGPSLSAPPNVIVILADDLGYADLGCYGGEIATPHLDSLARNGVRFTQFYNTARCWPTRGALLSGYYAQQIHRDALPQLPGGGQGVRPKWARLLPDLLKAAGYRSYHSGKWHVDGDVLASGFHRSLHTRNDGNYFTAKGNLLDDQPVTPAADESGYYATTAIVDHALECLRDHAAHHRDTPFFQYVAFIAPHFPLHALPRDIAKYRDTYLAGWEVIRESRFRRQKEIGLVNTPLSPLERDVGPPYAFPDALQMLGSGEVNRPLPWSELTAEQCGFQATKMAIHAAMIDRMDQEVGRLLAQLEAMKALDNTLILFASDNGASAEIMVRAGGHDPRAAPGSAASYLCLGPGFSSACNTPFRRHKTWVHEGGISTPFIAHWPKGIAAKDELRHTPAHVIDIVPTVLELAGIQKPDAWDGEPIPPAPGRSLVPALARDEASRADSLWWLHDGHRAIRIGDWKLLAAQGEPWQLYDLKTDRAEQQDLAATMPEKVLELEQAWQHQTKSFTELARQTAVPPNVVFIVADDLGYADMGSQGARGFKTPHLDRMAAEGTRFTQFYAAQAVCTASRAAVMTGCYPNRLGMHGAYNHTSRDGVAEEEWLLPEMFKERGYATAGLGKWHLGTRLKFHPLRHGFDEWFGIPYSNDNSKFHPSLAAEMPPLPLYDGEAVIELDPDQSQFTRRCTERAIQFIERNVARPFFLYLPHIMPHVPIFASQKFNGRTSAGLYGDVLEELDWSVGEVLATLKRLRLDQRTLVIFISDNGPFLSYGEHAGSALPLREGKLTTFEGGVRVPCLVRWPGTVPAGRVSADPFMGIDWLPTLTELAGGKAPTRRIDGLSARALLLGEAGARPPHDTLFFYSGTALQAVRSGPWKLHFPHPYITVAAEPGRGGKPSNWGKLTPTSITQSGVEGIATRHGYRVEQLELSLFNLETDPGEQHNVAPAHPQIVERLRAAAEPVRRDLGDSLQKVTGAGVRAPGLDPATQ